ncbi:MAG TPA: methylmalonyl Co-A mutase-associated GTPase MeaB, partial [Dehalococcoidia bacterium]
MTESYTDRVLRGERRALSRVITWVQENTPQGREALRTLYRHTGHAHTVGVTGSSGSGKSTLTGALAREARRRNRTVGIVAVDPSSPFTSGAILGDRIRMQDLTSDPGVFLRSMATRGSLGGLTAMAADVMTVLDAAGKDMVLIETVGAGQDEVEIARTAQTTCLVLTPGTGDDIQTMKAGIMEIADILVVNKADLAGTDQVLSQLRAMLSYAEHGDWIIPIVRVVANREEGVGELLDRIDEHRAYLESSGRLVGRQLERSRHQIVESVRAELVRRYLTGDGAGQLEQLAQLVADRELDPHSAAEQ